MSSRVSSETASHPVITIGDRARTTLRYVTNGQIDLSALNYGEKVFRANSLFDPDFSGVGSQPLGFDQWAAFYGRYRVLRMRYKCTFAAPSSRLEAACTCLPNLNSATDSVFGDAIAEPYAKVKVYSPNGGFMPILSGEVDIRKILGVSVAQFGEENFSASISSNPASVVWFHVRCETLSGGLSNVYYFLLELEFDCEFYARNELDLSLWSECMKLYQDKKTLKDQQTEVNKPSSVNPQPPVQQMDDKDVKVLLNRLLNK